MKKLLLIIILIVSCFVAYAEEAPGEKEYDDIYLYSTWDKKYLYIGCEVQCPNVQAKHKEYNASIGEDDGVEIVADLSHTHKSGINSSCFSFTASAAGGFEFRKGDNAGNWNKENIFSHKIATSITGTINNSNDIDTGYIIEIAVPWDKVSNEVPENKTISFSYRVRCGGKTYSLTDNNNFYNPSTWYDMVLNTHTAIFTSKIKNRITCGTYLSNSPTIDGQIKKGEWSIKQRSNIRVPFDKNIYKLSFKSQKAICKDLNLTGGNTLINSISREDVIKEAIKALEPLDAVNVKVDENLPNVLEAVRAYCDETNSFLPIIPRINAQNTEELANKCKEFMSVVPYQFRYIISDEKADKTLFVKTDLDKIDYEKLNASFDDIKISAGKDYRLDSRITSEYAYIITNYTTAESISLESPQQIRFNIKNVGSVTWKPLEVCLTYKWFKNDRFYSQCFAPIPITGEVKPGENYTLRTILMPVDSSNKPLPAGDMVIEAELVKADGEKLLTSQPFMFRTKITEEDIITPLKAIGVDMTKKMAPEHSYNTVLEAQNTSGRNWEPGEEIFADLVQLDDKGNIIKEFPKERNSLFIYEDTPKGIIGQFRGSLKFKKDKDLKGKYAIVFSTKNKKESSPFYMEKISFVKNDYNQKVILASNPTSTAKNSKSKFKVIIRNAGEKSWGKDTKLIANWFNERGELKDNGGFMQISKRAIKPKETLVKEMTVITPERNGRYYLVVGIQADGVFLSSADADRTNDLIVLPITIK